MLHVILVLFTLLTALPAVAAADHAYNLQVFFSNDVHGKTEPCG